MSLEHLEADLDSIARAADPDRWAFAAYRLAVARSETASSEDDVAGALGLLDRASRILTPKRSPVEYARVITAAANCHRQLSAPQRAAALFEEAADLLEGRVAAAEQAAALTNLGLARIEFGEPERAIEPLTRAVDLVTADDEESRRVRGAALLNRAQAHQASTSETSLPAAIDDYRCAIADFDSESPQRGMALHGLGAAILELLRTVDGGPAADAPTIDDALDAFRASLRILTVDGFPFQHALAQHSLGVAHERRAARFDLARALHCVEMSMSIFDPRLHRLQWQTAADTLARLESGLASAESVPRITHVVRLLVSTSEDERGAILRERLRRLSNASAERTHREIGGLAGAFVELRLDEYQVAVRSLVPVLMELPETVLDAACDELCAAHQATDDQEEFDGALDAVVHDLLHGPQRVRVRDMLEQHGWVRP